MAGFVYDNLKQFREDRGMSQKKLAEKIGVSQMTISNAERGESITSSLIGKFESTFPNYMIAGLNAEQDPLEQDRPEQEVDEMVKTPIRQKYEAKVLELERQWEQEEAPEVVPEETKVYIVTPERVEGFTLTAKPTTKAFFSKQQAALYLWDLAMSGVNAEPEVLRVIGEEYKILWSKTGQNRK